MLDLLLVVDHGYLLIGIEGRLPTRHIEELRLIGSGSTGTAATTIDRSSLAHHSRLHLHEKVTKWVKAEKLTSCLGDHISILLLEFFIFFLAVSLSLLIILLGRRGCLLEEWTCMR